MIRRLKQFSQVLRYGDHCKVNASMDRIDCYEMARPTLSIAASRLRSHPVDADTGAPMNLRR